MPSDAITLASLREPTLMIVCGWCSRYGRKKVERLIALHGARATLRDLLATIANCEKARSLSIHDRCKAKFEGLASELKDKGPRPFGRG